MTTLATPQLEQYISQQIVNGQTVVFDEFIFANIPNLTADNLQHHLAIPSVSHIVHRQAISQTGVVNQNAVVYSVTIGSDIGDFDFNFIGLINKSKGLLGIAIYSDTVKKLKNKNGIQGNSLTRSILLEFSNAPQHTNITIPAETWQIDFTLRLNGLDEKIRLTNRDLYGRAIFFDEGFLLKRKSGNNFTITAGTAYVEGVRANITADENITLALPCSVYVDVVHHCTITGAYQTEVKFLKTAKSDYIDTAGNQHYVQILADIDQNGNITDRRLLSPLLGINPKDLDDTTENRADKTGHTHKLPLASLLKKGITQLFSGLDSDAEDMAATPKAIKALKSLVDAITRNLGNYIPNSKKSNAIDSNSADTVATSVAVKAAYDKGVEAKNAADNANNNADNRVSKSGDRMTGDLTVPILNTGSIESDGYLNINTISGVVFYKLNKKEYLAVLNELSFYLREYIYAEKGARSNHIGMGGYDDFSGVAPFYVGAKNSNRNSTYHPFLKGQVNERGSYGATLSIGYTTYQQGYYEYGRYGRGVINLIDDSGGFKNWEFEHTGIFRSAGDVITQRGASLDSMSDQFIQLTETVRQNRHYAEDTRQQLDTLITGIYHTQYPTHYNGATVFKSKKENRVTMIVKFGVINKSGYYLLPESLNNDAVINAVDSGGATNIVGAYFGGGNTVYISVQSPTNVSAIVVGSQ